MRGSNLRWTVDVGPFVPSGSDIRSPDDRPITKIIGTQPSSAGRRAEGADAHLSALRPQANCLINRTNTGCAGRSAFGEQHRPDGSLAR